MLSNYVTSLIRTGVPYLVAILIAWVAQASGTDISSMSDSLVALLTFLFGTVYYAAARWAEAKWPKAGYLLGVPSAPQYNGDKPTTEYEPKHAVES